MPKLVTLYPIDEAARLLCLKPRTLRKLILKREIAVCRPSPRTVRIREDEIARLQRVSPGPRSPRAKLGAGKMVASS
jgi:excisionase family DNA binding protein